MTTRLLVTSDTHLETADLPDALVTAVDESDAVVHAGDFETREVLNRFDEGAPLHAVHGNADTPAVRDALPRRKKFEYDGVRVCTVHGHRTPDVAYEAAEMGAHLVVRGHSHTPSYNETGVPTLNPGSPTRPRDAPPSYGWLVCDDGDFGGRVVSLDDETLIEFGDVG
ncbi:YfcE family phosphodiesterase [Haladaptatus sp. F3-133]|uniref:Phosphoesterase n=1 Tax=Halorutilus salinus TaxID=2487751 RepID=A0A9Q4C4K3_9EURY|nr:YfcE family phosphodiesterase [Halorutilus salinus]MCX2818819.1 YfcE family phosphodiesterase [Halorutilus salinus]